MKYLKKFILNESVNTDEVQEFCDNHLAYLLDKGFYCEIYLCNPIRKFYQISIKKYGKNNNDRLFDWVDIKDDLIPFIIMLYKKYGYKGLSYTSYNMNILDRHGESEYIKIVNHELGKNPEIKLDYLDKLDIDYQVSSIEFLIVI